MTLLPQGWLMVESLVASFLLVMLNVGHTLKGKELTLHGQALGYLAVVFLPDIGPLAFGFVFHWSLFGAPLSHRTIILSTYICMLP